MDVEVRHTNAEVNLNERALHRLLLGFLRVIPMVLAGLYLLNTVLSYFGLDYSIISYLAGVGIIPWLFLLLSSYALKFCEYHRMFLWYIAVHNIICWLDYTFELPIKDWEFVLLQFTVAGIFLFIVLYLHQKHETRKLDRRL